MVAEAFAAHTSQMMNGESISNENEDYADAQDAESRLRSTFRFNCTDPVSVEMMKTWIQEVSLVVSLPSLHGKAEKYARNIVEAEACETVELVASLTYEFFRELDYPRGHATILSQFLPTETVVEEGDISSFASGATGNTTASALSDLADTTRKGMVKFPSWDTTDSITTPEKIKNYLMKISAALASSRSNLAEAIEDLDRHGPKIGFAVSDYYEKAVANKADDVWLRKCLYDHLQSTCESRSRTEQKTARTSQMVLCLHGGQ